MHGLFKKIMIRPYLYNILFCQMTTKKIHLTITFDFTKKIPNNHGIELSGIFFYFFVFY